MKSRGFTPICRHGLFLLLSILLIAAEPGVENELSILFTNDIHDHIRADYDGNGGLAFVSGYIQKRRDELPNVLVLDAGDIAEKGELVTWKTDSELTFRAFGRIGYDAWAPGNHDHDFGVDQLRKFAELAGTQLLCINLLNADGEPEFTPSRIYEKNGIRIGVIGMIVPRDDHCLDEAETAVAIDEEERRLRPHVDLVVALCHESSRECIKLSRVATGVDVFVSGHSHEVLHEPVRVEETGAIIVQAGSYAEYVGELHLQVDRQKGGVSGFRHQLVAMDHHTIAPDVAMLEWLRRKEVDLAPEANEIVAWVSREISYGEIGILAAEAIRLATGADVAFNASGQIVRARLPRGIVDTNAVFRTGGERGNELVEAVLTGAEIKAYLAGMAMSDWYLTQWSGFDGTWHGGGVTTGLDDSENYRVVMPELEWETRFLRLFRKVAGDPEAWSGVPAIRRELEARRLETTWTGAVTDLLVQWREEGRLLEDEIGRLARESGQDTVPTGKVR